ncbi:Fungal transcriptional regulatory protein, N-terminal [Pleurostoma richardsiae]|uniref:Fungal transcriptional regulatory protein, N-terminal n=1 Tax=Pleurostoma richardsiae TaxID=41990 RepID=A0AA38RU22_9PEZI|nr:Fungal transcriptional regulatory protein, N-terminal [Pleurostoma richardsiae]
MEHSPEQPDEERPSTVLRRYDVERSCLRCHERKVRCNKALPCSTCLRAKASCRYPGPERTKRRSQRMGTAKVVPRLEVLERPMAEISQNYSSTGAAHVLEPSRSPSSSLPPGAILSAQEALADGRVSSKHPEGFLVKEGASTRYINEVLFSGVLEKESELRSAIASPESANTLARPFSAFGFDGLLSHPQLSTDTSCLYPSRGQATQLWQPVIFAAINNQKQVPPDLSALLFSIYFAAVTSLRAQDTRIILGLDRESALCEYQRGLEVSLHMASFLDSPTITSLQAMSIYLLSRRNHNGGQSGWTLNGLLIRAAQFIGLHRDGKNFQLSPLDCEIRRRLWWQIRGFDARVAEDHGLSTGGFDGFCDTKLPLNVDDRDLCPDLESVPSTKSRWTEMTMFLVTVEMNQSMQQISRTAVAILDGRDKMTDLEQLLESTKERMERQYLQYCDPNIPIQKAALLLGRATIGKLEVFVHQQHRRGLSAEESAARATEKTLTLACNAIETGIELKTDEMLSNFQWLFSTFIQYHLLTYTLWHLCVRPEVASADRAWDIVNKSFSLIENPGWPSPGSKWNMLCKLRDKALDIRCSSQSNRDSVADLAIPAATAAPVDNTGESTGITAFGDRMAWDLDSICFPDWGGYASGF